MAISINGSTNVITGVAVGGLPDGIVDTDMLAAGAVTAAKRGAGAILQVVYGETTTEVCNTSGSYTDSGVTATITPSSPFNLTGPPPESIPITANGPGSSRHWYPWRRRRVTWSFINGNCETNSYAIPLKSGGLKYKSTFLAPTKPVPLMTS